MSGKIFNRNPAALQNEEEVRNEITRFLEDIVEDPSEIQLETHHKGSGRSDIAIPRSRLVFEVKAPTAECGPEVKRDGETQLEQLTRYVQFCYEREREDLFAPQERNDLDRSWIGVLTNGKVWWAWKWEDKNNERQPIPDMQGVTYAELIPQKIRQYVARQAGRA